MVSKFLDATTCITTYQLHCLITAKKCEAAKCLLQVYFKTLKYISIPLRTLWAAGTLVMFSPVSPRSYKFLRVLSSEGSSRRSGLLITHRIVTITSFAWHMDMWSHEQEDHGPWQFVDVIACHKSLVIIYLWWKQKAAISNGSWLIAKFLQCNLWQKRKLNFNP